MRQYNLLEGEKISLVSNEAYTYYRLNSKKRDAKKFKDKRDYAKVVNLIFKKASLYSMQYRGGVYLKNLLYLVPIHNPRASKSIEYLYPSHQNRVYRPIHTPCMRNDFYNAFFFDGRYSQSYSKYYNSFIQNHDPLYQYHYSLLKKLN